MKKLFTLFTVALTLVAFVSCSSGSTPSAIAEQYASAVKNGDIKKIEKLFYFEDTTEGEQMKAMVGNIFETKVAPENEKKGGIASFEVGEETISEDGTSANVDITFTYGNGETDDEEVDLINVDGKWYLEASK